jgi:hypothetical protein
MRAERQRGRHRNGKPKPPVGSYVFAKSWKASNGVLKSITGIVCLEFEGAIWVSRRDSGLAFSDPRSIIGEGRR